MKKEAKSSNFLQSKEWLEFQESFGRRTHFFEKESFSAGLIEHELPIVGKYLYCPKGPTISAKTEVQNIKHQKTNIKKDLLKLVELAKKENAGWIRFEPENEKLLAEIREANYQKIVKAPYDVQPKEIFVMDITKTEEELLSNMKSKTRYNIKLAQKKGVEIFSCGKNDMECLTVQMDFFKLTKEMAARQGIKAHPEEYYRKMIASIPAEILSIYIARYENRTIAAQIVVFFGDSAVYLHGSSSNKDRNVMAPHLLQWQSMLDAKKRGCKTYDFGGIKLSNVKSQTSNDWAGITNFKLGFSPDTAPLEFPGTYDMIINSRQYAMYKGLQKAKMLLHKLHK